MSMSAFQLLSILVLLAKTSKVISQSAMADCQIVDGRAFRPTLTTSLINRYQFFASSSPAVPDCAQLCLRLSCCSTAVYEGNTKICTTYSESGAYSGSLAINSTGILTTIILQKPEGFLLLISSQVNVSAIWNTTAGQNSFPSTPGSGIGNYWVGDSPKKVFDGNWSSCFASYGVGNASWWSSTSGVNVGTHLTIPTSPFILRAFRFITTANLYTRDPMEVTIEGSNLIGSALTLGSSWTLIYTGTTGLDIDPGRTQPGIQQILNSNVLPFSSYRFIITKKRLIETCVDYAEIELYASG